MATNIMKNCNLVPRHRCRLGGGGGGGGRWSSAYCCVKYCCWAMVTMSLLQQSVRATQSQQQQQQQQQQQEPKYGRWIRSSPGRVAGDDDDGNGAEVPDLSSFYLKDESCMAVQLDTDYEHDKNEHDKYNNVLSFEKITNVKHLISFRLYYATPPTRRTRRTRKVQEAKAVFTLVDENGQSEAEYGEYLMELETYLKIVLTFDPKFECARCQAKCQREQTDLSTTSSTTASCKTSCARECRIVYEQQHGNNHNNRSNNYNNNNNNNNNHYGQSDEKRNRLEGMGMSALLQTAANNEDTEGGICQTFDSEYNDSIFGVPISVRPVCSQATNRIKMEAFFDDKCTVMDGTGDIVEIFYEDDDAPQNVEVSQMLLDQINEDNRSGNTFASCMIMMEAADQESKAPQEANGNGGSNPSDEKNDNHSDNTSILCQELYRHAWKCETPHSFQVGATGTPQQGAPQNKNDNSERDVCALLDRLNSKDHTQQWSGGHLLNEKEWNLLSQLTGTEEAAQSSNLTAVSSPMPTTTLILLLILLTPLSILGVAYYWRFGRLHGSGVTKFSQTNSSGRGADDIAYHRIIELPDRSDVSTTVEVSDSTNNML